MNDIITQFKVGLSLHLEKQGSSLDEFEGILESGNTDRAVEKLAGFLDAIGGLGEKVVGGAGKFMVEAPQAALALSLLTGALGGGALYGMDNHITKQNNRLDDRRQEVDRMKNITSRLKSDYQLN